MVITVEAETAMVGVAVVITTITIVVELAVTAEVVVADFVITQTELAHMCLTVHLFVVQIPINTKRSISSNLFGIQQQ